MPKSKYDLEWDAQFLALQRYVEEHHEVPTLQSNAVKNSDSSEIKNLAIWVENNRTAFEVWKNETPPRCKLQAEKWTRLESVYGFVWNEEDHEIFERNLEMLPHTIGFFRILARTDRLYKWVEIELKNRGYYIQ